MYAKGRNKCSKGTVQVKNSHGRLQLVFSHPVVTEGGEIKSKRFYFSTGEEDTPLGNKRAAALAATIQRDIDYGEFDASLDKYKPAASLTTVTPIAPTPEAPPQPGLSELWERYSEFKEPQISQSTFAVDYRRYRNHIKKLPTDNLRNAIAIRDYLLANVTPNTAKRVLTNINACCDWAIRSELIAHNPFRDMAGDVYLSKGDVEEADINPFMAEERDAIIQAFQESPLYGYYASLVQVLFFTGCRPSEAMVKDRPKGPTPSSGSTSMIEWH